MCIEQGLHQKKNNRVHCRKEQLQRRIFWHCYAIDRYSSTTLERPSAIADHDITVPLPLRVNDVDLDVFHGSLDEISPTKDLNDMSIFLFYVELRRITSRIDNAFNKATRPSSGPASALVLNGRIHLNRFWNELAEWCHRAPIYLDALYLYHRSEWWEFMYERYRLLLLRAAVEAMPKPNGRPPKELIERIAESSTDLILLYSGMFEKGQITYTRSYFQMLFTGGLSLMFSISVMDHFCEFKFQGKSSEALQICEDLLKQISLQLEDSSYFAAIFEALHWETIRRSALVYQHYLTSTVPTRRNLPTRQEPFQQTELQQSQNAWYDQYQAEPRMPQEFHVLQNQREHGSGLFEQFDNAVGTFPYVSNTFPQSEAYANPFAPVSIPDENAMFQNGCFLDEWFSMEAGLGEYAYGDNYANLSIWDQIQLDLSAF